MRRKSWIGLGALSLAAIFLMASMGALAAKKPVKPATGHYTGTTSQEDEQRFVALVSKHGKAVRLEFEIVFLVVKCQEPGGQVPVGVILLFGKKGNGLITPAANALTVTKGHFSYKGAVGGLQHGIAQLRGKFTSRNRLTGSAQFTYKHYGGFDSTCESGPFTFTATHD